MKSFLSNISIGKKITGSMVILISILFLISVISFLKLRTLDSEVNTLAEGVLPLTIIIAQIAAHSLKQELVLERMLRYHEMKNPDERLIEKERKSFEEIGLKVDAEIKKAERLLNALVTEIIDREDVIEISKIIPLLEIIERDHQNFHDNALKSIASRKEINRDEFERRVQIVEKDINVLGDILSLVNSMISNVSLREAKEVAVGELEAHHISLIVSAIVFLIGILIAPKISRGIVAPLRDMIAGAEAVANGDLEVKIPVTSKDEVGALVESFNKMTIELKNKERIKETFGKYVDPRIVEKLLENSEQNDFAEGQKKEMTIFFSDVEKFSTIAESLTPNGLVKLINKYFSLVSEPIAHNHGVIDKFIGDAVMAFWGPPFTDETSHARLACQAAIEQFEKLEELNANISDILHFRKGLPKINIRIGICTGEVVSGNIGSSKTKSYTVMGDTVNIAARLESANKQYGTRILLSESTKMIVKDEFITRKIDNIIVVGKLEPVFVYELFERPGKVEGPVLELIDFYEKAYVHYQQRQWKDALKILKRGLEINPDDVPSEILSERVKYFMENPPSGDWDGVWHMSKK